MFIVDDLLIGSILAAIAAGSAGSGILASASGKTKKAIKQSTHDGKTINFRLDGALNGIDPSGTVGHTTDGFPVNSKGEILQSDGNALDRLGMSSYDIVNMTRSVVDATNGIIGASGSDSIFGLKYPRGNGSNRIRDLTKKLKNDPTWVSSVINTIFGKGSGFEGWDSKQIVKTFAGQPTEVLDLLKEKENMQKAILEKLKSYDPSYKIPRIVPKYIDNQQKPDLKPLGGDIENIGIDLSPIGGGVQIPQIPQIGPGDLSPIDGGVITVAGKGDSSDSTSSTSSTGKTSTDSDTTGKTSTSTDTTTKTKTDEKKKDKKDKEPKPPKPPYPDPDPEEAKPSNIVETGINMPKQQIRTKQVQWYAKAQMGGQDVLKLTDTEKLQELKNWSLYDYITGQLADDPDNLLALQNDIHRQMRFLNTYSNPIMRREPPEPQVPQNWQYSMRNTIGSSYPMRYDGPIANKLYYDNWANDRRTYLDNRVDMLNSVSEPDIAQIANSRSKGYTAIDNKLIAGKSVKFSLVEDIDSSSVDADMIWMSTRH